MINLQINDNTATLYNDDCFNAFKQLPDKSIDLMLCDLPYGTLGNTSWDVIIPFEPMWAEIKRILKPNRCCVFFASQPFTTKLIASNYDWFGEELIWDKLQGANILQSKKRHMKIHENIVVFNNGNVFYNPQMTIGKTRKKGGGKKLGDYGLVPRQTDTPSNLYFPKSIQQVSKTDWRVRLHPTEKPVTLLEYLIRTYSNENDTVLDFCCGSANTGIAAINTKRNFIGVEIEEKYYEVSVKRFETYVRNDEITMQIDQAH